MKLQIDTVAKTIRIEQSAKITDVLAIVKKLLPNEWKDYYLEAVAYINNWGNPIYVPFTYTAPQTIPFTIGDGTVTTCYNVETN